MELYLTFAGIVFLFSLVGMFKNKLAINYIYIPIILSVVWPITLCMSLVLFLEKEYEEIK